MIFSGDMGQYFLFFSSFSIHSQVDRLSVGHFTGLLESSRAMEEIGALAFGNKAPLPHTMNSRCQCSNYISLLHLLTILICFIRRDDMSSRRINMQFHFNGWNGYSDIPSTDIDVGFSGSTSWHSPESLRYFLNLIDFR